MVKRKTVYLFTWSPILNPSHNEEKRKHGEKRENMVKRNHGEKRKRGNMVKKEKTW